MPKIKDLLAEPAKERTETVLMNTDQFAEYVGIKPNTAYHWRARGVGPKYIKPTERTLLYRRDDVDEWLASRELTSTSDKGGVR